MLFFFRLFAYAYRHEHMLGMCLSIRRMHLRRNDEKFVGSTRAHTHDSAWSALATFLIGKVFISWCIQVWRKKNVMVTHSYGSCLHGSLWICCTQFDGMVFFACYCIFGAKCMVEWLLISFTAAAAHYDLLLLSRSHGKLHGF